MLSILYLGIKSCIGGVFIVFLWTVVLVNIYGGTYIYSMYYDKISDPGHYRPGPLLEDMQPDFWSHCLCWVTVFWLDIRSLSLLIHLCMSSIYHFISPCSDCFHMAGPRLHRPTQGCSIWECVGVQEPSNGLRQSLSPPGCISGGDTEACWWRGGRVVE